MHQRHIVISTLLQKNLVSVNLQLFLIVLVRSEEHTSALQSHSGISYAVFCLKKKKHTSELQSHPEISYSVFCLKKKNSSFLKKLTHFSSCSTNKQKTKKKNKNKK